MKMKKEWLLDDIAGMKKFVLINAETFPGRWKKLNSIKKLPRRNAGNFIIKKSVITSILWIKCA